MYFFDWICWNGDVVSKTCGAEEWGTQEVYLCSCMSSVISFPSTKYYDKNYNVGYGTSKVQYSTGKTLVYVNLSTDSNKDEEKTKQNTFLLL